METGTAMKKSVSIASDVGNSMSASFEDAPVEDDEPSLDALTEDECSSSSCSLVGRGPGGAIAASAPAPTPAPAPAALPSSPLFLMALDKARRSTSMADEDVAAVMSTSFDESTTNDSSFVRPSRQLPPRPPVVQHQKEQQAVVSMTDVYIKEPAERLAWEESDAEAVGTLTSSLARITEGMSELVCARNDDEGEMINRQSRKRSTSVSEMQFQDGLCVFCGHCGCLGPCSCYEGDWAVCDKINQELLENATSFDNDADVEQIRVGLEKDVTWLLGCAADSDVAAACVAALRSWLFFDGDDASGTSNLCGSTRSCIPIPRDAPTVNELESRGGMKRVMIRNRSVVLRAQAARMRRLKSDMNFPANGAQGNIATTPYPLPCIALSSSTDNLDVTHSNSILSSTAPAINRCATEDAIAPPQDNSANKASTAPLPSDLFYDSDPGETISPPSPSRRPKIKRASSYQSITYRYNRSFSSAQNRADFYQQSPSYAQTSDDDESIAQYNSFVQEQTTPPITNVRNVFGDEYVSQFTKELSNGNITLVYHPSPAQASSSTSTNQTKPNENVPEAKDHLRSSATPVCVQAWLEMGARIQSKLVQPKFMWRAAYQPDLQNKKKLHESCVSPDSLELLNIIRVIQPTHIDRSAHPFAKQDNSFILISNDNQKHLFEANSQKERDRFVTGLKLVIARLASKIIVGNEDVFDEFFSPWGTALGNFHDDDSYLNDEERYKDRSKDDDSDCNINDYECSENANESAKSNPLVATAARESSNAKQLWGLPWQ